MIAATPTSSPRVKPKLRGVSHQIAFFVALVACAFLVATVKGPRAVFACAVYGLSLSALFGISALYHRPMWSPEKRALLRRADHSAIYIFIAGTYTPLCLLAIPEAAGLRMLVITWTFAVFGVAKELLWPGAPRWITTVVFLVMGWVGASSSKDLYDSMGLRGVIMFLTAGVLYSTGAIIYARKRPDPLPAVFGYHEIFHLLVIAAAALHYVAITQFVWGLQSRLIG